MRAKSLLLAAILIASPASAFAQSATDQSAPATSPDGVAPPAAASPTAAAPAVPATAADIKPNAPVYDPAGAPVGKVESVTSAGAVVSTGVARAQVPAASFNKNAQGLVIGMTKSQFEAAVAQASPPKS